MGNLKKKPVASGPPQKPLLDPCCVSSTRDGLPSLFVITGDGFSVAGTPMHFLSFLFLHYNQRTVYPWSGSRIIAL